MERDLNAAKVRLYHFLLEKVATELTEDETVQQEIKKIRVDIKDKNGRWVEEPK